jgi:hypothetical protein
VRYTHRSAALAMILKGRIQNVHRAAISRSAVYARKKALMMRKGKR